MRSVPKAASIAVACLFGSLCAQDKAPRRARSGWLLDSERYARRLDMLDLRTNPRLSGFIHPILRQLAAQQRPDGSWHLPKPGRTQTNPRLPIPEIATNDLYLTAVCVGAWVAMRHEPENAARSEVVAKAVEFLLTTASKTSLETPHGEEALLAASLLLHELTIHKAEYESAKWFPRMVDEAPRVLEHLRTLWPDADVQLGSLRWWLRIELKSFCEAHEELPDPFPDLVGSYEEGVEALTPEAPIGSWILAATTYSRFGSAFGPPLPSKMPVPRRLLTHVLKALSPEELPNLDTRWYWRACRYEARWRVRMGESQYQLGYRSGFIQREIRLLSKDIQDGEGKFSDPNDPGRIWWLLRYALARSSALRFA